MQEVASPRIRIVKIAYTDIELGMVEEANPTTASTTLYELRLKNATKNTITLIGLCYRFYKQ